MKTPDTPLDEQSRLQTLRSHSILDTPPEERFDRLTRMAKRLFDVPIALVSLVDENRQWFKSSMGLDATETPRDVSFCGHAILGDDVFLIPNATRDERFADNPLVQGAPDIRFYAGCPLQASNGQKLGTLCIIDRAPRDLSTEDLAALKDLAAMVEGELAAIDLATIDELTGISNRRGFLSIAQHALKFSTRQQTPASLVFVDMDGLKLINDTLGHGAGDEALGAFADLVKRCFRDCDVFGRLGGDEFAILLTGTSRQAATEVIARFRQSVDSHNKQANSGYDLSFSHGIVEFDPEQHPTVESLLEAGDELMYEHKKERKLARTG